MTAERDVVPLPVGCIGAMNQGDICGRTLSAVHGHGIAMAHALIVRRYGNARRARSGVGLDDQSAVITRLHDRAAQAFDEPARRLLRPTSST